MLKINEIKETTIQEVVCEEMDQLLLKTLTSDEMVTIDENKNGVSKQMTTTCTRRC